MFNIQSQVHKPNRKSITYAIKIKWSFKLKKIPRGAFLTSKHYHNSHCCNSDVSTIEFDTHSKSNIEIQNP